MEKIVLKFDAVKLRKGVPVAMSDGRYGQRIVTSKKAYNRKRDRKVEN